MTPKTAQRRKSRTKRVYYAHALCMYDRHARMYGWRGEERVAIQKYASDFLDINWLTQRVMRTIPVSRQTGCTSV